MKVLLSILITLLLPTIPLPLTIHPHTQPQNMLPHLQYTSLPQLSIQSLSTMRQSTMPQSIMPLFTTQSLSMWLPANMLQSTPQLQFLNLSLSTTLRLVHLPDERQWIKK